MNFESNNEEQIQADFEKLQKVANCLKELGYNVIDRFITKESMCDRMSEFGFSLITDGACAVRASYSKRDGLEIWYTNGFEDPDNPERKVIEEKIKDII